MTGAEVRAIRRDWKIDQEAFGLMVGTTGRMIRYYEAGRWPVPPMLAKLIRLAKMSPEMRAMLAEPA